MKLLAEPAGRSLERTGNRASRGMIAHDRTRLIGQLLLYPYLYYPSVFPFYIFVLPKISRGCRADANSHSRLRLNFRISDLER